MGRLHKVAIAVLAVASSTGSQQNAAGSGGSVELPAALPAAKTIRVNGTRLSYVEQGRGEAVILIHGFLMDYRAWTAQIGELSKHYRVIAYSTRHRWPNAPASSSADPPASELSPAVNAGDLVGLIKSLRLGRVHLVGHSGGAAMALRVARDHPELVRSIVLGEPGSRAFATSDPEANRPAMAGVGSQVRELVAEGNTERALDVLTEAIVGKEAAARIQAPWIRQMLRDNAWQLSLAPGEPEPPVTCEEARRMQLPVLLLGGEMSPRVFPAILNALEKCLPNHQRAILPNASHGLQLDNPAAFNGIVLQFLKRHSGRARRDRQR